MTENPTAHDDLRRFAQELADDAEIWRCVVARPQGIGSYLFGCIVGTIVGAAAGSLLTAILGGLL